MTKGRSELKRKLLKAGGWQVAKRVAKAVPFGGTAVATARTLGMGDLLASCQSEAEKRLPGCTEIWQSGSTRQLLKLFGHKSAPHGKRAVISNDVIAE